MEDVLYECSACRICVNIGRCWKMDVALELCEKACCIPWSVPDIDPEVVEALTVSAIFHGICFLFERDVVFSLRPIPEVHNSELSSQFVEVVDICCI